MKLIFSVLFFMVCVTPSFAQGQFVRVTSASGGDLQLSKLYSVDYKCRLNAGLKDALIRHNVGTINWGVGNGVLNEMVSIVSSNAAAIPTVPAEGNTPPNRPEIFSTNVVTLQFKIAAETDVGPRPCGGQFFISGNDNYRIDAQVAAKITNQASQFFARFTALVQSSATTMYALFRATKPPEFTDTVDRGSALINNYLTLRDIFGADATSLKTDSGPLRVGKNWVYAYDGNGNVVSSLELWVRPVVSLVMDGHTKFLAAYNASAATTSITLSGTDDALRGQCAQPTQAYYTAGISDDRDVAFLLYRRLILADNSIEKIAKCLGIKIGTAALSILDKLQRLEPRYRISLDDLKNLPRTVNSDQPHNRPTLADEMQTMLGELARHLQGQGLRGAQLTTLSNRFAPMVVVEDMTTNYSALQLLYPEVTNDPSKTVSKADLLASLKAKGLKRWLCIQRTKAGVAPAIPLYDPDIDSAVMVIAAKAEANEQLDKNKSTLFGVHLKFDRAFNSEPLVINRLIFEERKRDLILKDNPTCIAQ